MSNDTNRTVTLVNGRVLTMNSAVNPAVNPAGESTPALTGVAVIDGVIVAVGSDSDVLAAGDPTARVIDLEGAVVTPGLIDSHTHPLWGATLSLGIDLGGITTMDALLTALTGEADRMLAAAGTSDDSAPVWVRGWNLDYAAFDETAIRGDLIEDAVHGLPTLLLFYDLHTGLATKKALAAANIVGAHEFGDVSEVVVDAAGTPTGELREPSAYQLVVDAAPTLTDDEERDALRATLAQMNAVGLTSGAVMDGSAHLLDVLAELEARDELTQRLRVFLWHRPEVDDEGQTAIIDAANRAGNLWRAGGIKLFSDGVIDTGTAWLHEPDTHGNGLMGFWPDWNRYKQVIRRYDEAGLQLTTHAVGDKAVSAVLDAYAELPEAVLPRRVEHLEVMSDADVAQLGPSGVVASMQPLHMQWRESDNSDNWAERLGERASHGFLARAVLDAGAALTLGSDWPVAQFDPRIGMAWATGRRTPGTAAPAFEPEQRLTGQEALLGYTRWAAEALGDTTRGRVAVGQLADLTVFATDPTEATPDELVEVPVLFTIVDGRVVFEAA